jgi:hypothetical protein
MEEGLGNIDAEGGAGCHFQDGRWQLSTASEITEVGKDSGDVGK